MLHDTDKDERGVQGAAMAAQKAVFRKSCSVPQGLFICAVLVHLEHLPSSTVLA